MNFQSLLKTLLYRAGYSIKRIRKTPLRHVGAGTVEGGKGVDLMRLLHKVNPYDGFEFSRYAFDAHGWGGESEAFRELISELRPDIIVEVGTWKGASALEMARATHDFGLSTQILCVDTWLGALEFWTDQDDVDRFQSLGLKYGYPTVYYQFLANVCHKGFQDRIVPFPQASATGALWLRHFGITSPMVYVDASHEEEDVYQDLCSYWEVVRSGGVLFGDDYSWDGVRLAVERFVREEGRRVGFRHDKWVVRKLRG